MHGQSGDLGDLKQGTTCILREKNFLGAVWMKFHSEPHFPFFFSFLFSLKKREKIKLFFFAFSCKLKPTGYFLLDAFFWNEVEWLFTALCRVSLTQVEIVACLFVSNTQSFGFISIWVKVLFIGCCLWKNLRKFSHEQLKNNHAFKLEGKLYS